MKSAYKHINYITIYATILEYLWPDGVRLSPFNKIMVAMRLLHNIKTLPSNDIYSRHSLLSLTYFETKLIKKLASGGSQIIRITTEISAANVRVAYN